MLQNIFFQYLSWHFLEMPKNIWLGWKNFLKFGLNYFSIPLLLKTIFSPWHRYSWAYPRGFDIGQYAEVFLSNLISRFLGLILRTFLIMSGILIEVFIILGGLSLFLIWLALPFLLIAGLILGLKFLF